MEKPRAAGSHTAEPFYKSKMLLIICDMTKVYPKFTQIS
jgi:hypothetical protein